MKKIMMVVVAMLSMTMTYAEDNTVNNVNAYDMTTNMRSLARALQLTDDQKAGVADVHATFCAEMKIAANADNADREQLMKFALYKDLKYMYMILNKDQYDTYARILNATLNNRGLNK